MNKSTLMRYIIFLLFTCLFTLNSCVKTNYCADCIEVNSGYSADLYCGNEATVDSYIDEMTTYDPNYPNQDWVCSKSVQ